MASLMNSSKHLRKKYILHKLQENRGGTVPGPRLIQKPQTSQENGRSTSLMNKHIKILRTSLVAQWLRLHTPNAGGLGSIPGQGTRSHMHAATKSLHATTKEPASRN